MKWSRKNLLLLCILLLPVFYSNVFCQVQPATPIHGRLSVDSTGVRTTQISSSVEAARIGLSDSESGLTTPGGALTPGYTRPEISPKCQWVRFSFSGTKWQWFIRKPGCYAAKAFTAWIQSNGSIRMGFGGFNNLYSTDNFGDRLDMYYGITSLNHKLDEVNWMTYNQFNNYHMNLCGHPHVEEHWALWQKICIEVCDNSGEYEDRGHIDIDLLNNQVWIEDFHIEQSHDNIN